MSKSAFSDLPGYSPLKTGPLWIMDKMSSLEKYAQIVN